MTFPFDPNRGPVVVQCSISGPLGQADLRLILDTGATTTLIRSTILVALGYAPQGSADRVQVTMGNGVESLPRLILNRLSALGEHRIGFAALSHPIPPSAGVDGLLGLDFLRGRSLIMDFRTGQISLL